MVDLASLQHKDSMIRQSNLGEFLSSLQKNTIPLADLNSEDKYELISILVENIKNSNPRLSLPSLECIQALSDTCLGGEINILNKSIISMLLLLLLLTEGLSNNKLFAQICLLIELVIRGTELTQ